MLNYLNCFKPINDINFIFASLGDGGNKFVLSSMPVFFFLFIFLGLSNFCCLHLKSFSKVSNNEHYSEVSRKYTHPIFFSLQAINKGELRENLNCSRKQPSLLVSNFILCVFFPNVFLHHL